MYYVIPVSNFVTDNAMKLGDSFLIPHAYWGQYLNGEIEYDGAITADEKNLIHDIMEICINDYSKFMAVPCIIMKRLDNSIIDGTDINNEMLHLEKVCYEANSFLDLFRVYECNHLNRETLPGLPGLIKDSFTREGIAVNEKTGEYRSLLGNVFHLFVQRGLGLYTSIYSPSTENLNEYECFFSTRKDEVYLRCRAALSRISNSMYIDDLSISFVYLMSTLEMLASSEYINFRKVKSKILPFICENAEEYHNVSGELRFWSESLRTSIVHNGENILNLVNGYNELKHIFALLCGYIRNYCSAVIATGITTFVELENYRLTKQTELGIK